MKKKIIIVLSIIALILANVLMWVDTNSLIVYVEDVFKGEVPFSEVENTPLNDRGYYVKRDNSIADSKDEIIERVDIDISRRFVLHDFFDGFMFVKYSCYGYNQKGEEIYGSIVNSKWIIHKEDGQWRITDIIEGP